MNQGPGFDPTRMMPVSIIELLASISGDANSNWTNNEEKEQHSDLSTP